jgi:hypothetical protein
MATKLMRHKAFVGPTMYWNARPLNENRERIRDQAEAFINEIGAENVVSVTEHAMTMGPFSVVVWYRAAEAAVELGITTDRNFR